MRPLILSIIAILAMLIGLINIVSGALIIDSTSGIVLLIDGLIAFIIGYGMWKGITIIWYVGMIYFIIQIVLGIAGYIFDFFTVGPLIVIISILIVFYLTRSNVKKHFNI